MSYSIFILGVTFLLFYFCQVCAILWSKEYRELITSHGFALNQLTIWKYPAMTKVAELTGTWPDFTVIERSIVVIACRCDDESFMYYCDQVAMVNLIFTSINPNSIIHRQYEVGMHWVRGSTWLSEMLVIHGD